jgi:Dolichyl-phosphate-mannose-protein mannosyltransferase
MGVKDVALGTLMLAFTLGTAGFAASRLARGVAWGVLASALFIAEHLIPLALGILNRGTVLATTALLLTWAVRKKGLSPHSRAVRKKGLSLFSRWVWLIPIVPAAGAVAYLGRHAGEPSFSIDTLSFQLPQVARWIQTGSLWQLDQFFPDYSNATYPSHGNVLLLAVTLPYHSTFLARLVAVPFAAGTCAAVYASARELGAGRAWALLAASVLAATPVFARTALVGANTDPEFLFSLAAAVLILLRDREQERWIAAVALGLALGTKWYALTVIPPLALIWLVARRPRKREVARMVAIAAGVGGIWMLRNWILAGNPLFPQPLGPFNAPRDIYRETAGSSLADYATDVHVWKTYLWPQFRDLFAGPGLLLTAVPVLGLFRRGRTRAVAIAALLALLAYAVTPYSALGPPGMPVAAASSMRYALPALALGAMVLATAPRLAIPIAAIALLQGVPATYDPSLPLTEVVLAALGLGAAIAASVWRPRAAAVTLAILALIGINAIRTPSGYGAGDPAVAWLEANAPSGHRIALAGDWSVPGLPPTLPAFGPRLANEVAYAGPFVRHMLRHERDPRRFAERLRGYDLVVVGRGFTPTGRPAPEEAWAQAAGFTPVASSSRLAVLALRQ